MPDQGVAVGVQPGRLHGDHRVAGTDPAGAEQVVGLHDAGGRPRDVVLVGLEQARVLGGLATDQRAAGLDARLGDALDDRRDPLGDDPAGGDVVGEEQRLRAAHDQVVDEHADQVEPDRVVLVERLRDRHLGAHAVGGAGQQRPLVRLQRAGVEQAGEAADAADHLGAAGLLDPALHQLHGPVTGLDRDTGRGVRRRRVPAVGASVGWVTGTPGLYDSGSEVVRVVRGRPRRRRRPARWPARRPRSAAGVSRRFLPSSCGSGSATG